MAMSDGYRPFPNDQRRNILQEGVELPLMIRALSVPKYQRILETGTGRGVALPILAEQCNPSELIGLDIDDELLAHAQSRTEEQGVGATLVHADIREMPFPDESFDIVVDFGTCYHITSPEVALREIVRVLSPGGLFIHETPLAQLLAHPTRTSGHSLPWDSTPGLIPYRNAGLWASRRKQGPTDDTFAAGALPCRGIAACCWRHRRASAGPRRVRRWRTGG